MRANGTAPVQEPKVRVMLCHNVPVARIGLRTIIEGEHDMEVIGEADDIESGLALIDELHPDVILTDLSGGRLDGLDAIRSIKNVAPDIKVLIRAYQRNGEYFLLAMRAGADGYFTRDAGPGEVANAIRTVNRGQNYLDLSTVTQLVTTFVAGNGKGGALWWYRYTPTRHGTYVFRVRFAGDTATARLGVTSGLLSVRVR